MMRMMIGDRHGFAIILPMLLLMLLVFGTIVPSTSGFLAPSPALLQSSSSSLSVRSSLQSSTSSTTLLFAKKKRSSSSTRSKGFGKVDDPPPSPPSSTAVQDDNVGLQQPPPPPPQSSSSSPLTSIPGGSSARPTMTTTPPEPSTASSVEDRTANILRDKYGLRTREEQQAQQARQDAVNEQRQKIQEWKALADKGDDFDLIRVLPDPVLIFIDRFLKFGVATCTTLFILAGIAVTVEAGSKATNNPLPTNIDDFITNVVEPNFTPGLLVLLGFSISLGAFAALQLGSSSSTYREDR